MTQYIPPPLPTGASPVGNSHVSMIAACPHKAYLSLLRPCVEAVDEDGATVYQEHQGLLPRHKADPLLAGDVVHQGLEAYYRSGCRDGEDSGEYQIDAAIAALEAAHSKQRHMWADPDRAEKDLHTSRECLLRYDEVFGPQGLQRDWPTVKVFHDANGEPVVEREFWSQLTLDDDPDPVYYSVRVDVAVMDGGYLREWQHKTSVPSFVHKRLASVHYDSQMTGTEYVLRDLWDDLPRHGIKANVIVKGWSERSKFSAPAIRETTTRTPEQLEAWRRETIQTLRDFGHRVGQFRTMLDAGEDPEDAADWLFPRHGTRHGYCESFNRQCEFWSLCHERGLEESYLRNYEPRRTR